MANRESHHGCKVGMMFLLANNGVKVSANPIWQTFPLFNSGVLLDLGLTGFCETIAFATKGYTSTRAMGSPLATVVTSSSKPSASRQVFGH